MKDDEAYRNAHTVLQKIRQSRRRLTVQEERTIKGQALAGDIDGAERGLKKILMGRDYFVR